MISVPLHTVSLVDVQLATLVRPVLHTAQLMHALCCVKFWNVFVVQAVRTPALHECPTSHATCPRWLVVFVPLVGVV
jgi:hypothetical protein